MLKEQPKVLPNYFNVLIVADRSVYD